MLGTAHRDLERRQQREHGLTFESQADRSRRQLLATLYAPACVVTEVGLNAPEHNYVFTTVLFASVLFFAGVSNKLSNTRNRFSTVALATALLVVGMVIIATFPVQI